MASISAIRSIGHRNATKLRKSKVRTTDALLEQARHGQDEALYLNEPE